VVLILKIHVSAETLIL